MRIKYIAMLLAVGSGLSASSNILNGDDPAEGTLIDPSDLRSYAGGLALYNSSLKMQQYTMNVVSEDVGAFTDELTIDMTGGGNLAIDSRYAPQTNLNVTSEAYRWLNRTRVSAGQAAEALLRYGPASARAKVGEAFAIEAQATLLLGEMYCSGVPLTRVLLAGDMQYTAALSTTAVLEQAVALFDSAYHYGKDSVPIATLAQVGKGRALLGLGRFAEAAAAVANVPTPAQYTSTYSTLADGVQFWTGPRSNWYQVANGEGTNGLHWVAIPPATQDPRVPVSAAAPYRPLKYNGAASTIIMANGIQARMIEAEAQLQPANAPAGPWLATINAARATRGLVALDDPGTESGRVDLLFRERAFWFYQDGIRLGDLRRLARQYNRLPLQLFPTGLYPHPSVGTPSYGNQYVFTPSVDEGDLNPLYKGCLDKDP